MDVYRTALLCLNSLELMFTTPCERSGLCHLMALADYVSSVALPRHPLSLMRFSNCVMQGKGSIEA